MLQVIRSQDLKPLRWSGGTTTQLFIFPPSASYQKMNFAFRVSTATVEGETSTFTSLPGVQRILMVLNSRLQLTHEGHHSSSLGQFDSDNFSGEWQTQSVGLAEDFNLMVRHPQLKGEVRHFHLEEKKERFLSTEKHGFLYIYRGQVELNRAELNERLHLLPGDSLYFDFSEKIHLKSEAGSDLIFAEIR